MVYFNTSHVTVYHYLFQFCGNLDIFQYISCYCLSWGVKIKFADNDRFQYISCYCLSNQELQYLSYLSHFNTSHVTVYLLGLKTESEMLTNFNTSHVTVYQKSKTHNVCIYRISIHLMLLFITVSVGFASLVNKFQYISCYCLSTSTMKSIKRNTNFNTSHVTVYLFKSIVLYYISIAFQYISCYCLSTVVQKDKTCSVEFQYISCYCLS